MKIMSNVKSVSLGLLNCGAITEDGNLWMWGSGELGDGTTETTYNPVKIMSNVKSISNGNNMNAAITRWYNGNKKKSSKNYA